MCNFFANKNCVITYHLYIIPRDADILISAEHAETFASAPDDYRNKLSAACVNFNVADIADSTARFSTYDFFVAKIGD